DQLVEVGTGSSVSVVLIAGATGVQPLYITEDVSPLATGKARLTVIHANPGLIRVDVEEIARGLTLKRNLGAGDYVGPFDLRSGEAALQLVDTEFPDQIVVPASPISLTSNVNYLVVFVPGIDSTGSDFATDALVFQNATRMTVSDTPVRFINAAPNAGPLTIDYQGISGFVSNLQVGTSTVPLPVSLQRANIVIRNREGVQIGRMQLDPWGEELRRAERLVVISDLPEEAINR